MHARKGVPPAFKMEPARLLTPVSRWQRCQADSENSDSKAPEAEPLQKLQSGHSEAGKRQISSTLFLHQNEILWLTIPAFDRNRDVRHLAGTLRRPLLRF